MGRREQIAGEIRCELSLLEVDHSAWSDSQLVAALSRVATRLAEGTPELTPGIPLYCAGTNPAHFAACLARGDAIASGLLEEPVAA